mmetsp:Transcript_79296/g.157037  ORF Transcript_79296/g.157037 Transcript_79296/m.157037 type:complete len:201 (+) Transcript_79296:128-730(+)
MGCMSSTARMLPGRPKEPAVGLRAVAAAKRRPGRTLCAGANTQADDIAEEAESQFGDAPPQWSLPTLLESAFQRSPEMDTLSSSSSMPTIFSAAHTPSQVASNYESIGLSSNRPELDKDSIMDLNRSVGSWGALSLCGRDSMTSLDDLESICNGSIGESRVESQAYLQELEAVRLADSVQTSVLLTSHEATQVSHVRPRI